MTLRSSQQFSCVRDFIEHNFRHFNAASLLDAARGYEKHIDSGGTMFLAMAGAMSTAEIGITLAEMIREGKIHAISCTGANLEEDVFNLVAHNEYRRVPHYRYLSAEDEEELFTTGYPRVTDTCIPEEAAMMKVDGPLVRLWKKAQDEGARKFPHEFFYELLLSGTLEQHYQIDPKDSWVLAAAQKNLPMFVAGWEDSTMGNSFASELMMARDKATYGPEHTLEKSDVVKSGIEYLVTLTDWYEQEAMAQPGGVGFFQIGGGISGDFPICVVPLINLVLEKPEIPKWSYFCQISDSTTSYGSYSGAVPNEKITWGKLDKQTPSFVIESDATIVAPLIFAYVLGAKAHAFETKIGRIAKGAVENARTYLH